MSKTNGRDRKGKKSDEKAFRFINYDLSEADKEWLRAADCEEEFSTALVEELVSSGYKYTLSIDQRNQCFIAALTDRASGTVFENCCLTGRGATAAAARHSLLYRHVHLADGDWSFFETSAGSGIDDFA